MQDYEMIARLGRGGMGVVDLARDRNGTRVAMKRLTLHGSASDIMRARQRLLREAEVLRRLRHPNIVRLLDVVEDGDEIVLIMPYLNGGNLAERVGQHGPAPVAEVERLAQRLLGALATAHAKGIIHRDIKPANVLFDERGEPCLADFGVAHTWDQTGGLTVAGMVVGTPGFMAPEQARDEVLTPATDVFALGATLLYTATGAGPFGSGGPGLLMVRSADGKVERIPRSVPPGLRRRLRIMLDPRPQRRPTAAALLTGDQTALRRPPHRYGISAGAGAAVLRTGAGAGTGGGAGAGGGAGGVPGLGPRPGGGRKSRTAPAMAFVTFAGVVAVVALSVSSRGDDNPGDGAALPPTDQDAPTGTGGDEGVAPPSGDATTGDEDENSLVDEAQGFLEPGDANDSFWLPMGDDDGTCPTEVRVVLTTSPDVNLLLQVVRTLPDGTDDLLVDAPTQGGDATVAFRPGGCEEADGRFRALVVPTVQSPSAVAYRIIRGDS